MELTAEHYRRAAIAYNAYCKQTGGKSLVSGEKLPAFDALNQRIKDAWAASAIALSLDFERETEHQREMAAFGQQCYQDRCENAYVEQSVMKKTVTEAEEAVARRCVEIAQEVVDGLEDAEFNCDIYGPIQLAIRREFDLPTGTNE